MLRHPINSPVIRDAIQGTSGNHIYFALGLGMAINLVSIYIGNPYVISLLMLPVAVVATLKWMHRPLLWAALVSVVAANPVNRSAPISLNLIFGLFFILLSMRNINKLPSWILLTITFAVMSTIGSVISWGETAGLFTQLAAIINYVVGPFFLIPLIYFRLQSETDFDSLLKVFVGSLIVPSVTLMFLGRHFGTPVSDFSSNKFDYLVNVSVYHLGNINFQLIRTQAGIPIAVLICISFAVLICAVNTYIRLIGGVLLAVSVFLLLVTGSVGSSLSALCGMALILGVASRYIPIKKYLIMIPILVVLALAGWNQLPLGVKGYVESRYEEKLSSGINLSDRSGRWQTSLNYLLENPQGRGWGLWVAPIGTFPHNDYISYGIAFGFVCGLLYLFVPVKILFTMVSAKLHVKNPAQVAIYLAGIGAVTVLLVNSLADHLTANRWYFNVVWSIVWYGYFAMRTNVKVSTT